MDDVILQTTNLVKRFPVGRSGTFVNAVNGVNLSIKRGEVLKDFTIHVDRIYAS